jgi:acid phosphatase
MTLIRRLLFAALALIACCTLAVGQVPSSKHVYVVAEENHSYQHLIGSPNMPYLNSLINQNGLATQFYANQHSSLPDYFWVTAGQAITQDNETTLTFDVDNIVRRAMQLGLSYKAYAQSLPSVGYAGVYGNSTSSDYYLKRHVPLPYFSDMGNSPTEMLKLVPVDQLLTDIQSGNLPNFAFITPDSHNDMHDCPSADFTEDQCEQVADQFLQTYIKPLLARPEFQPGGDGLLFIWADEADLDTDNACSATVSNGCGGHILVAVLGPKVKKGFQSTTTYHHESMLRTMLEAMGVTGSFPGAANNAPDMAEFFSGAAPQQQLTISSPTNGATVSGQMHVVASAQSPAGVMALQIYVDHALTYTVNSASMDTMQTLSPGTHLVTIKAWNSNGNPFSQQLSVIEVAAAGVTVTSPTMGSTVPSPVHVVASGTSSAGVAAMQIYADDQLAYTVNSSSINTNIPLSAGTHYLVIKMWDNNGTPTSKSVTVNITAPAVGVTFTSPKTGATTGSPVQVVASATTGNSSDPIGAMRIYVDDQSVYTVQGASINTSVTMSSGSHQIVIVAWDKVGASWTKDATINVQ